MDRTEELLKIVCVFDTTYVGNNGEIRVSAPIGLLYDLLGRTNSNVNKNELILDRIMSLNKLKEFSNDPSRELADMAEVFEKRLTGGRCSSI